MKIEETTITLHNMRFYAYHGVLTQEQKVGNDYEVTLTLTLPAEQAMWSDNLSDTINYAEVYHSLAEVMREPKLLLEAVAGQILQRLKSHYPLLTGATCAITKLTPPISNFDASGVTFTASATW